MTRAAAGEHKARVRRRVRRPLRKPLTNSIININARFIELTRDKLLTVAKRIGASARHATYSSDGPSWLDIAAGLPILYSRLAKFGRSMPAQKPVLTSRTHDVDDFAAAQEFYHANGWTDGLPVVPPTEAAVEACLEWALMPPDQLIGIEPVRAQPITAEKLAINAVMAGCLPVHFPVVAAAWQAMMKEEFLLHGVTSSTGGCAILAIINGPVRVEIGANAGFNALANSDRATAVIGRALRLGLINLLDVRPGGIDRTTLGHPGKFSYCFAEDEEDTSWQPLSVVRGIPAGVSAVTVMAAMAPRQIMNEWTTDPREILETFAAEMRANQRHYSIYGGNYAIVIPKQLREHIERAGWTKRDIADFLYERARVRRAEWATVGKGCIVRDRGERVHAALESPDHLLVVAAGGPAGGFGAVIPPWMGSKTKAVTAAIGVCVDCEPLKGSVLSPQWTARTSGSATDDISRA